MSVLVADGVVKEFRNGRARVRLGPASFEVADGSFTALVGRSGSGKSTILNCVAGLARVTGGRVDLGGVDLTRLPEHKVARLRREAFGFVYQDYTLIDSLTGAENISLPARMSHRKLDEGRLDRLAAELGLADRVGMLTSRLSGGQRQRVAIARAIANDAQVIFADEPTGALDPITSEEVIGVLLRSLDASVKAVVMATHDPELAARADTVLVISRGCVEQTLRQPTPSQVLAALRDTPERAA
ncbi:ABC transporter ATP-binding protein [Georgenia sp. TF02-10]|uniref:ABC transporter ATP-binding protein n=1 Tax=Georgenia sp. TF02-10 TaxID=2917725 RepID=UPI001FA7ED2F|nr:ABC transporter ATP-binding protein [Georgenia sp. TF02-10]UNX55227.1 ABC transporter ATP-binding protein [Georgenia sp. TF02-10]